MGHDLVSFLLGKLVETYDQESYQGVERVRVSLTVSCGRRLQAGQHLDVSAEDVKLNWTATDNQPKVKNPVYLPKYCAEPCTQAALSCIAYQIMTVPGRSDGQEVVYQSFIFKRESQHAETENFWALLVAKPQGGKSNSTLNVTATLPVSDCLPNKV